MKIITYTLALLAAVASWGSVSFGGELKLESSSYLPVQSATYGKVNEYLIKFNLTELPANVKIIWAIMSLKVDVDSTINKPLNLMVHPVSGNWTPSDIPATVSSLSKIDTMSYIGLLDRRTGAQTDFFIKNLVQAWSSGTLVNNGLAVTVLEHPESELSVYTDLPGVKATLKILYQEQGQAH